MAKIDDNYLRRLGVLPYLDEPPRARRREPDTNWHSGRRLRGEWTMELQEDLRAVHGIDLETELAETLAREIDTEIVQGLRIQAEEIVEDVEPYREAQFAGDMNIEEGEPRTFIQAMRRYFRRNNDN